MSNFSSSPERRKFNKQKNSDFSDLSDNEKEKTVEKKDKKEKYPLSKNGYQRVGKCYPPMSKFLHPFLNEKGQELWFTVKNKSLCPIKPTKLPNGEILYVDECDDSSIDLNDFNSQSDSSILTTRIMNFDPATFLSQTYQINDLEEIAIWYSSEKDIPIESLIRVINLSIRAYAPGYIKAPSIKYMNKTFDELFIGILKIICLSWAPSYYEKLKLNLMVKGNDVYFEKKSDKKNNINDSKKKIKIEKIESIITVDYVNNKFTDFVKSNLDSISSSEEFNKPLDNFEKYLFEEIKKTLETEDLSNSK